MLGGAEVVDGADVFYGRPCIQAWLEGSPPTVHQEQLNTAYVGVHWRKQAVKAYAHASNLKGQDGWEN